MGVFVYTLYNTENNYWCKLKVKFAIYTLNVYFYKMYVERDLLKEINNYIDKIPVTAIIGARQVGKSTMVKKLLSEINKSIVIDLEKSSDKQMLEQPESFFELHKDKTICIDEIQLMPNIFPEIRSFVDNNPETKFIILGSSSPDLLRQTSETLAGRIFYYELSPFLFLEINNLVEFNTYRLRGGLPLSILAKNDKFAFKWLQNYIKTFLERDLRNFGFNIPPETLRRLWTMLAHINGQIINYSQLGNSMGLSHTTIKYYIDILQNTFMLRIIQPYYVNIKKRLIKSPKVYLRDTGILHALLNIDSYDELYKHPIYGSSWEITVIENIINKYKNWNYSYYRTAKGVEIDLILTKANKVIAIEIKSSITPRVTNGFWIALKDINATEAYVIAPVKQTFPLKNNVWVYNLTDFLNKEI